MEVEDDSTLQQRVQCVWVLSGSPETRLPSSFDWISKPNRVVAADAGSRLLDVLGLQPDIVLGDFDSIDRALMARLEAIPGLDLRRYRHDTKLETDTELAVLASLAWDPRRIVILGAIGGRLDHALANVLLLAHPRLRGRDVCIIDGDQEVFLVRPAGWHVVRGLPGDTVSLLPVAGDALGVSIEGFEYPLNHETLTFGTSRGVSNVLLGPRAQVRVDSGDLLVVVQHSPVAT